MKKVLIVEDDVSWQRVLGIYAQQVGAQFRYAVSAGQAMEIIDDWHPDAIILDILLSSETGIALLNEIKTYDDLMRLPVLVCSNITFQDDELKPFQLAGFFDKSTAFPDDIKAAIKEVLYGAD